MAETSPDDTTPAQVPLAELLQPNRGWFFGAAGMVAAWILDRIDAPLWLAVLTLVWMLVAAVIWPWLEATKARRRGFWSVLAAYVLFCLVVVSNAQARPVPLIESHFNLSGGVLPVIFPPNSTNPIKFVRADYTSFEMNLEIEDFRGQWPSVPVEELAEDSKLNPQTFSLSDPLSTTPYAFERGVALIISNRDSRHLYDVATVFPQETGAGKRNVPFERKELKAGESVTILFVNLSDRIARIGLPTAITAIVQGQHGRVSIPVMANSIDRVVSTSGPHSVEIPILRHEWMRRKENEWLWKSVLQLPGQGRTPTVSEIADALIQKLPAQTSKYSSTQIVEVGDVPARNGRERLFLDTVAVLVPMGAGPGTAAPYYPAAHKVTLVLPTRPLVTSTTVAPKPKPGEIGGISLSMTPLEGQAFVFDLSGTKSHEIQVGMRVFVVTLLSSEEIKADRTTLYSYTFGISGR